MSTTYRVGQEVRIIANETCHAFDIGQVVKLLALRSDGTPQKARSLYADDSDWFYIQEQEVEAIKGTNVQFMQEKPAPAKQATGKMVYAVTNKDGILELAEYRDTAREMKAYYGGLKAGVTIVQYAPVKEIR